MKTLYFFHRFFYDQKVPFQWPLNAMDPSKPTAVDCHAPCVHLVGCWMICSDGDFPVRKLLKPEGKSRLIYKLVISHTYRYDI